MRSQSGLQRVEIRFAVDQFVESSDVLLGSYSPDPSGRRRRHKSDVVGQLAKQ